MKINSISSSSLESFNWCEFQWFLNYCLGFKQEDIPASLLGGTVHKVIDIITKNTIAKEKELNFKDVWNQNIELMYEKSPLIAKKIEKSKINKLYKKVEELLYSPSYSILSPNIIASETRFNIKLDHPIFVNGMDSKGNPKHIKMLGIIDRVDKVNDKTIEIIDYKTGKLATFGDTSKSREDTISDMVNKIQPRLYYMAAKYLYPWAENILVTFIYLTEGGPYTIPLCDDDLEETWDILKKSFVAISQCDNPKRDLTWKCRTICWYGKSGICENIWNEIQETSFKFVEMKYSILNKRT